jgi:hypothetical protein
LCGREVCHAEQLDWEALRPLVYARTFAAALHNVADLLGTVYCLIQLAEMGPLTITTSETEELWKRAKDMNALHQHFRTLANDPLMGQQVFGPAALAEVHADLSRALRLDCTVDTSRLHGREIRLDRRAYYIFASTVMQVALLAVRSAPRTQIEIHYEFEGTALGGRAQLPPSAADLDPSGCNLMCLVASIHGATVAWGRAADAPMLRWTYPVG